jgi:hypothetical protein
MHPSNLSSLITRPLKAFQTMSDKAPDHTVTKADADNNQETAPTYPYGRRRRGMTHDDLKPHMPAWDDAPVAGGQFSTSVASGSTGGQTDSSVTKATTQGNSIDAKSTKSGE